jgi:hypothetical protein
MEVDSPSGPTSFPQSRAGNSERERSLHATAGSRPDSAASPESVPFPERRLGGGALHWWVGAGTTILAAIYLSRFALVGWIPHDEGTLGQVADRVLRGQLPHRDFVEPYTGGLTFLHALAFRLLGVKLTSLRWVLLGFACAWVPAVYAIAARVAPPLLAALITALSVTWALPNYFAPLPSWYNLFFATFGTWCLLRYLDAARARWLVLAGICGGLSLVIKVIGFYYVAAGLLFLVYCEQLRSPAAVGSESVRPLGFACFKTAAFGVFAVALVKIAGGKAAPMEFLNFIAPGWLLAFFLGWSEWRQGRGRSGARFRRLTVLLTPFVLGVAVPVVLYVLVFVHAGAMHSLYEGVFILPQLRFAFSTAPLPGLTTGLAVVPYAAILVWGAFRRIRGEAIFTVISATAFLALLYACRVPEYYRLVWYSVRPLVPVLAAAGCLCLLRPSPPGDLATDSHLALLLLIGMAAMVSLVQSPYAFAIYFCYAAPLVALALLYVVEFEPLAPRRLHLCWLVFYLLFAGIWLNTGFIRTIGAEYVHIGQDTVLDLPRGGLRVHADYEKLYSALYNEVRAHTAAGSYIYAGPDSPEIYFLTETRNPTRVTYDFMDDALQHVDRILEILRTHDVRVAVLNTRPEFSPSLDPQSVDRLIRQFTSHRMIGWFVVMWRDAPWPRPESKAAHDPGSANQ